MTKNDFGTMSYVG